MNPTTYLPFVAALLFALVHLFSPWLGFLDRRPRSRWLSAAGGISVAYVILQLLPEVAAMERHGHFRGLIAGPWTFMLVGLCAFYSLDKFAIVHGSGRRHNAKVYRLHILAFGLYNILSAYLLHEQLNQRGVIAFALYVVAIGLHFLVVDRSLTTQHGSTYHRIGRWGLATCIIFGAALGELYEVPKDWVAILFALLAGSIMLNVLKEELPGSRQSRLGAFLAGALVYAGIMKAATSL